MSFFPKINVTKCLGHHYAIWTSDSNILLAQKKIFRPAISATEIIKKEREPPLFTSKQLIKF
jgi:hypothetical protein